MKIEVIYKKSGVGYINPRDIRNITRDLVKKNYAEDEEFQKFVNNHEHVTSPVIYSKPTHSSFSIITYKENGQEPHKYMYYMSLIALLFTKKQFTINGIKIKVVDVKTHDFKYTDFAEIENIYKASKLMTPLVIGSSNTEYAIAINATKGLDGKNLPIESKKIIKDLAIESIKSSIIAQKRDWFEEDAKYDLIDLKIKIVDMVYAPIRYKHNQYFPAIKGTIICNKRLPKFIGYKIGFGFGEIANDRRKEVVS